MPGLEVDISSGVLPSGTETEEMLRILSTAFFIWERTVDWVDGSIADLVIV